MDSSLVKHWCNRLLKSHDIRSKKTKSQSHHIFPSFTQGERSKKKQTDDERRPFTKKATQSYNCYITLVHTAGDKSLLTSAQNSIKTPLFLFFTEKLFFLKWLTKPEIFFDYNGNESWEGGPKQIFCKSWHYWVSSVALSKEKKKGCFYTVLGTCQKTFVTGCIIQILCEIYFEDY